MFSSFLWIPAFASMTIPIYILLDISVVIPADAGIQVLIVMDTPVHGYDEKYILFSDYLACRNRLHNPLRINVTAFQLSDFMAIAQHNHFATECDQFFQLR